MDEFYFEKDIRIPETINWNFNLGIYQLNINDVVITGASSVSFHEEMKNLFRLVAYDREGNVLAYSNASVCEDWVFEVAKYPRFRMYHLNVHKERRQET